MIRLAITLLLLVTAFPTQSEARFDPGNVGLPGTNPGIDPGDPPPPPPPPPPLSIRAFGLDFVEVAVRPPAGRTSRLEKQAPGSAYAPFQSPSSGVETIYRDANLGVGKEYCYRLTIFGGGAVPDEAWVRCATTDWRVGFQGPGIDPTESATVLRLFDWRDTQRLAAGSESEPALYHMNVLVEGADPLTEQGLRYLGMHVQAQPIFSEELESWNDSQAVARECSGPVFEPDAPIAVAARAGTGFHFPGFTCTPIGRWLFAVVPGGIYNEIRDRMLEQIGRGEQPGIRALVFRRVPVAAALPVGVSRHSLSHVYLGQQGLEYNGIQRCSRLSDGTRVCTIQQEILGWIARKVVKWVVEIGDAVVEAVRSAIGKITRLIKGEVRLDLNFRLLNTDPGFGTAELMRSGWSGQQLHLKDVKVEVRQGLGAFYGHTDSQGYITLYVAKNVNTKVCIQLENDTAELTEFLIEKTICVKSIGQLTDYRRETIDVRHDYANTLAAMTDARDYLLRHAGIEMPKVTVLVGSEAEGLAVAGRSFAPCLGRVPSTIGLAADILGIAGALLNPAFLATTITIEFLYSVDVILRPEDDGSRGVPVHEYAHTVMCEMLLRQGIDAFEMAWTDVILATSDQSAGSQASYLNEAFADFLTEQIVGGTNYFSAASAISSEEVNYCPAGGSCYDQNVSDKSSFPNQVARIVSILHDAFDGNPQGLGPNDGSHWVQSAAGSFTHVGAADSNLADEPVRLFGGLIEEIFDQWDDRGQLLREDSFLGGLADTMKGEGIAESDVCALFALHDPGAACPGFVARRSWTEWLDETVGVTGTLDAFADATPPAPVPGGPAARGATLIAELADLEPLDPGAFEPGDQPCEECSRPVVLDGTQTVRVRGVGRDTRETAFAFRLGDGSFKGLDPLGRLFAGTWSALDEEGEKLRLRSAADADDVLTSLLVESLEPLGVDPATVRVAGRAKITLKLTTGGKVTGKVVVPFKVVVGGETQRGTYVAKVRGA